MGKPGAHHDQEASQEQAHNDPFVPVNQRIGTGLGHFAAFDYQIDVHGMLFSLVVHDPQHISGLLHHCALHLIRGQTAGTTQEHGPYVSAARPICKDQDSHHGQKIQGILPQGSAHRDNRHGHLRCCLLILFLPKDCVHQYTDHHAEYDRTHSPGHTHFHTQYPGCQDNGQHIDRRPGIQEGRGRPQPCTHAIDACKQRQHRTAAHSQHRP